MPRAARIAAISVAALILLSATNLVYHVARKPSELLYPVSTALGKMPAQTWLHYGPLFREYSTSAVTPELLAALAQVESAGNPMARTYWRWRLSWNPLAIYQPASSAVGTYQMTDAAFADARRYCIRDHAVVDGCWLNGLYTRLVPSHAVELTAVFLDRNVAAILAGRPKPPATRRQKEELATIIHLCGPTAARGFARRGFAVAQGERCGDHDVATYLARVNAMKREFLRLAAVEG
jgi:Transglycosylase SLT domain